MTTTLSPDEQVKRVKAALAEYGYPDVAVWWNPEFGKPTTLVEGAGDPPLAVVWVAVETAGVAAPCWSCLNDWWDRKLESLTDCERGNCHHPDADRWPPRELLVRGAA